MECDTRKPAVVGTVDSLGCLEAIFAAVAAIGVGAGSVWLRTLMLQDEAAWISTLARLCWLGSLAVASSLLYNQFKNDEEGKASLPAHAVITAYGSNASTTAELEEDGTPAAKMLATMVQNDVSAICGSDDASAVTEIEINGTPLLEVLAMRYLCS